MKRVQIWPLCISYATSANFNSSLLVNNGHLILSSFGFWLNLPVWILIQKIFEPIVYIAIIQAFLQRLVGSCHYL